MNKETLRELVGYDIDSFSDEILNAMNMEVMSEVAVTTSSVTNDGIEYDGNEIEKATNEEFTVFVANEVITVTFSAGAYKDSTGSQSIGTTAEDPLYKGKTYWFVYKITNDKQTGENKIPITGAILTDEIPTNFEILNETGDSGYSVTSGATGGITVSSQRITTQGEITIPVDGVLTVYVKVKVKTN